MTQPALTTCDEMIELKRGVFSALAPSGELSLVAWPHTLPLGCLGVGERDVLRMLSEGPCTEDRLPSTDAVRQLTARLRAEGWLTITVCHEGRRLYSLEPRQPLPEEPQWDDADLTLSRFAVMRRHEDSVLVESPRSWCDVRVHDAMVVGLLAGSASPEWEPVRARVLKDMKWADIMVPTQSAEDTEFNVRQWSPHELWFHERTRLGQRGYFGSRFGGTYWAKGEFVSLPAFPENRPGPSIDLFRPDLDVLAQEDQTLTSVLEGRRSIREYAPEPLNIEQLGEFLYRCARTRQTYDYAGVEYQSRPYPSGGSSYELELYPIVSKVAGLPAGMYHYDSRDHRLRLVQSSENPAVRRLVSVAMRSLFQDEAPQVFIVVAARFGRVMWKYESMAYSLILKHVGVLYQTMYCVATAMNLAPCGVGGGDSSAFVEAAGVDPLAECSVGEFALGSRPATVPEPSWLP